MLKTVHQQNWSNQIERTAESQDDLPAKLRSPLNARFSEEHIVRGQLRSPIHTSFSGEHLLCEDEHNL